MEYNNTKEKLIKSLERSAILLESNVDRYLSYRLSEMDLPELDGEWEYGLKWNFTSMDILKWQLVRAEDGMWEHLNEQKINEITMIVTAKKFAELTNRTDSYVRRQCRNGKLDCRQVGKEWLVNVHSIKDPVEDWTGKLNYKE